MDEELKSLHKLGTWDLVPIPLSESVVSCHWVNKIKTYSNGSIERFKLGWLQKDIHNSIV